MRCGKKSLQRLGRKHGRVCCGIGPGCDESPETTFGQAFGPSRWAGAAASALTRGGTGPGFTDSDGRNAVAAALDEKFVAPWNKHCLVQVTVWQARAETGKGGPRDRVIRSGVIRPEDGPGQGRNGSRTGFRSRQSGGCKCHFESGGKGDSGSGIRRRQVKDARLLPLYLKVLLW